MNTPGCMHPQLLAFDASQADRRIVHFKWDTEWDTLWATTRIPPLLVLDCMGYKADLTVSFLIQRKPSSAMAGVFASYGRLKHRADECLSTTLAGIGRGCSRSGKASATTWQ